MTPANRVTFTREAWANMAAMPPDVRRQARALIILLAASPLDRLVRRMDVGMVNMDGLKIWSYQADDFWLSYIEETDGSLLIFDIWQR